jgi:hypothetical protein
MKRLLSISLLVVFTLTLQTGMTQMLVTAHNSDNSGCVGCHVVGSCWECNGTGQATSCPGVGCGFCDQKGVCGETIANIESVTPLKLSVSTIKEIAVSHPRFAATLAILNRSGVKEPHQIHWTPVPLYTEDVDAFINHADESGNFFTRFNRQAKRINVLIAQGKASAIVYDVSVESDGSSITLLKLQVVSGSSVDPNYSTLEIKPKQAIAAKKSTASIAEWTIR